MDRPKIVIIAGPNGAGKTTFARAFLPQEAQCPRFINPRESVFLELADGRDGGGARGRARAAGQA